MMTSNSNHKSLYKHSGSKASSLKQTFSSSVRREQGKQRDLFFTLKRFKVDSVQSADEFISALEDEESVTQTVKLLKQGKRLKALTILASAFAQKANNADVFVSCDGLQALLSCFHSPDVTVLQTAALCAVNLTAGASTSSALMPMSSTLSQFLQGSDPVMQEYCAWALGNMAGDSSSNALVLQSQGCVHALVELISTTHHLLNQPRSESVLFALINLAQSSFECVVDMQENRLFERLPTLFDNIKADSSLNFELGWLVSSIYSRMETFSKYPEQYPLICRLVSEKLSALVIIEDTSHCVERVILPFVHCLANMMGMNFKLAEVTLEDNLQLVPSFCLALTCDVEVIQKEALRAVHNCMGGLCSRLLITFHPRLLDSIVSLCQHPNASMALQALTVIDAMTKTSTFVDGYLVTWGLDAKLTSLVRQGTDASVTERASALLDALKSCSTQVHGSMEN